jgi:hypothetical protein
MLDDESRVTGKTFADGTSLNIVYENGLSRTAAVIDALQRRESG